MSFARLWFTLKAEQQSKPNAPASPDTESVKFISYNDLMTAKDKVEADSLLVMKRKQGIDFLYSSLFRALSAAYQLDAEETHRLIFAVADRHSQNPNR